MLCVQSLLKLSFIHFYFFNFVLPCLAALCHSTRKKKNKNKYATQFFSSFNLITNFPVELTFLQQ